jgi:hypothetical protein
MGISLTGLTPATTYDALIKVGDNGPIDGTLKVLSDGLGTNLPMEVSTTGVNLTGSPTVNSVAIANTTQVAAKQDTLVSGTNIKTINGTSVLGSGNIAVVTSPSGVSGAIQFSDGSAFASDASNLFWDDTNNRLGIGTNAPSVKYDQQGGGALFNMGGGGTNSFRVQRSGFTLLNIGTDNAGIYMTADGGNNGNIQCVKPNGSLLMQISDISTVATIKGVGSTSATTSLLVQNSAGTNLLQVRDDGAITMGDNVVFGRFYTSNSGASFPSYSFNGNSQAGMFAIPATANAFGFGTANTERMRVSNGGIGINTLAANNASATLQIDSTTQGVLFPRMTTTQKNAITAVAGLVVYDSTTNKLCCYNGSTWNDLF